MFESERQGAPRGCIYVLHKEKRRKYTLRLILGTSLFVYLFIYLFIYLFVYLFINVAPVYLFTVCVKGCFSTCSN
jgi:hypothetical protein